MESLESQLAAGMEAMDLACTGRQLAGLLAFLRLLQKWNRVYNLTALQDPADMASLHLLDSLSVLPYLHGRRVLDVGTGAGLPGLPLALFAPERQFTLLDGNAKKTRFVTQAAIELELVNVRVVHSRIEDFQSTEGFDCVLARAFAGLPEILAKTGPLLNQGGIILAQKGKIPHDEIQSLGEAKVESIPLQVPGINAERHLIAIRT